MPIDDPDPVSSLIFLLQNDACCPSSSSSGSGSNDCGPCYNGLYLTLQPYSFGKCPNSYPDPGPDKECLRCVDGYGVGWGKPPKGASDIQHVRWEIPGSCEDYPAPRWGPDLYTMSITGHLTFVTSVILDDGSEIIAGTEVDSGPLGGYYRVGHYPHVVKARLRVYDGTNSVGSPIIEVCCKGPGPEFNCPSSSSESGSTPSFGSHHSGSAGSGSGSGSGGGGGGGDHSSSSGSSSSESSSSGSSGSGSQASAGSASSSGNGSHGSYSASSSGGCEPFTYATIIVDAGTTYNFVIGTQYAGRPWMAAPQICGGTVDDSGSITYTPTTSGSTTITILCPP